ncbi:carbonic anhydrase 4-like [Tiliqua scincoides]|uniref:carbonic anhydrase 4-like n=1 Tax=Tiliqua scincoides TaxID=71010 RepID=UPI003461EF63
MAASRRFNKSPWCYDDHHCGPSTWLSMGQCGGKRQSPIDINPDKTTHNSKLGPIILTGYGDSKKLLEMKNTGKTVDVELGDGLQLSGHGLPAPYTAKSFHLHWGNGNSRPGSEHYINGRQYSMELHIVHTKNNMSVADALKDPEGIAVLGFFVQGYEKTKGKTAEAWESLIKYLPKVSVKGEDTDLDGTVSLLDLLGTTDLARYYRYPGSLTTPDCNEVVLWTIFVEPILVPLKVVAAFPELYSTSSPGGPHLENNFRPLQKIEERTVEASASMKSQLRSAAALDSQPVKFLLLIFITTITSFLPV